MPRTRPCTPQVREGRLRKANQFAAVARDVADHNDAAALLKTADADSARHLETLLKMKTRVGYGHTPASQDDLKKAQRAGDALLKTARAL